MCLHKVTTMERYVLFKYTQEKTKICGRKQKICCHYYFQITAKKMYWLICGVKRVKFFISGLCFEEVYNVITRETNVIHVMKQEVDSNTDTLPYRRQKQKASKTYLYSPGGKVYVNKSESSMVASFESNDWCVILIKTIRPSVKSLARW